MNRFAMAITLTCVLVSSALAGEVPSVGPESTVNKTTQTTSTASPGDIPTVGVADQTSNATLSALLTVLGLLGI